MCTQEAEDMSERSQELEHGSSAKQRLKSAMVRKILRVTCMIYVLRICLDIFIKSYV